MHLQIDRYPERDNAFVVSWFTINGKNERSFDSRDAAESFADAKMGKRGSVMSTLDMTAEQLATYKARLARTEPLK